MLSDVDRQETDIFDIWHIRSEQNGRHMTDDRFKGNFLNDI